ELRCRQNPDDLFRTVAPHDIQRGSLHERECLERTCSGAPFDEVHGMDVQGLGRIKRVLVENNQPVRAWIRQWSKQDGVHEREDRGICANADGEREYRDGAEPRTLSKRAERIRHILAKAVDQREAARVSTLFFPLSDRAHLPKGVGASVRWRHARSDVVINEVLEMVLELLVELPFYLA